MNVFLSIKNLVEKETGLNVVMRAENIAEGDVLIKIAEIEKTNIAEQYRVSGAFEIKTGETFGWENLKSVLDLNLTDSRASSSFFAEKDGFMRMDVDFSLILNAERGYVPKMKKLNFIGREHSE